MLGHRAAAGALLVVVTACSGGANDPLLGSTTTATPGASTTLAASAFPVGAEGGILAGPEGIELDVLAGTFPGGAEVTIATAAAPSSLPEGAVAAGPTFSITTTATPELPVVIVVPLPAGEDSSDLVLVRTTDDGAQQFLVGAMEGPNYVVASPGFSTFTLTKYDPYGALASLDLEPGFFRGVFLPESFRRPGVHDDLQDIMNGLKDAAAARSVRLLGPGELAMGEIGVFAAADFVTPTPQFNRYAWNVHGPLAMLEGAGTATAVFEANGEGRAVVTVEATDPRLGLSAFASLRVFVGEASDPGLSLIPDQTSYLPANHEPAGTPPQVTATPINLVAPFTYEWAASSGESDVVSGADGAVTISLAPPSDQDIALTVTVTDAAGTTVSRRVGLIVAPRTCQLLALAGPVLLPHSVATPYEVLVAPGIATDGLTFTGSPPFASNLDGLALDATFPEPGVQVIDIRGQFTDTGQTLYPHCDEARGIHMVRVTGLPLALSATLFEPPATGSAGAEIAFLLDVSGGLLVTEDRDGDGEDDRPIYRITIDWGDDQQHSDQIISDFASVPVRFSIGHVFANAGEYDIRFVVTSIDSQQGIILHDFTVLPSSPLTWNSGTACPSGESEGYGYTWTVVLTPPADGAAAWDATVLFHDCPGGGRARYDGKATMTGPGQGVMAGVRTESRGALGSSSPESAEITLVEGQPPSPNFVE